MREISILLADYYPVVREGLLCLLNPVSDFRIIGQTNDGLDAVRLAEQHRPNVLISGLKLKRLSGLNTLKLIRQKAPETHILIFTAYERESFAREAVQNGVAGYILKNISPDDLIESVRTVASGGTYFSPSVAAKLLNNHAAAEHVIAEELFETLTRREREVVQLSSEGHTYAEIGARLTISPRTAEIHRANAMRKLGTRSLAELIAFANRQDILAEND